MSRAPAEGLFRLALRLLPRDFRERWEAALLAAFRQRTVDARVEGGAPAAWAAAAREVLGILATAVRARRPDPWARRTAPDEPEPNDGALPMEQLISDLRFAFRTFVRRPGMMGFAALSLALGIGASTAMFSVVDSVLLRPLPYEAPEELVNLYKGDPSLANHPQFGAFATRGVFSGPEFWWVVENERVFEGIGGYYAWGGANLGGEGRPERLSLVRASPGLLPVLGVEPLRGRLLGGEDDPAGGARSVMITEGFWESRYARDPDAVGSEIRLNDEPFVIVGVLPDEVKEATADVDAWTLFTGSSASGNWGNHSMSGVVARLRQGVTPEMASQELTRLMRSVPEDNDHGHTGHAYPALQDTTRNVRAPLLALIAGAVLLLVVGCGNVATILIGAGIDREQEIAVRGALGAGRGRLTRQLLTESLALAAVGAGGGVAVAVLVTEGLVLLAPPDLPRLYAAAVDGRVLAFAVAVAGLAGVVFGMAPALGMSRPDLAGAMSGSGTRGNTGRRGRLQSAVVVGEIALATVLLVSATLLGRTLLALDRADPGLDADGLYAVRMAPPWQRFTQEDNAAWTAAVDGYFQEVVDAVESAPGVSSVAVTSVLPLTGDRNNNDLQPEGWDPESEGEDLVAERRIVSGNYFETTGSRVVEGRGFTEADNRTDAAPVMIISEGLARRVWPGESAVGKQIAFWGRDPSTVVGVAEDVRDESLLETTTYAFYVPARQLGPQTGNLLVRVVGDPATVLPAVRERIWQADPDIAITDMDSFDDLVADALSQQRYRARLMIVFAVLAAVFATLGVYAVTARSVARRTREMGIRVALGAKRGDVVGLVMGQSFRLAFWGLAGGLTLSLLGTRFLQDMLWGVSATDPVSLVAIAALVAAITIGASLPPSRRATRVDPSEALRAE